VLVSCPLRRQRIKPAAQLTHLLTPLRPSEAVVEPLLDGRDCLPGGRVSYRLVLRYTFSVAEKGSYKAAVPLTNGCVRAAWCLCACVCVRACMRGWVARAQPRKRMRRLQPAPVVGTTPALPAPARAMLSAPATRTAPPPQPPVRQPARQPADAGV
jgi:hypothetical protein